MRKESRILVSVCCLDVCGMIALSLAVTSQAVYCGVAYSTRHGEGNM